MTEKKSDVYTLFYNSENRYTIIHTLLWYILSCGYIDNINTNSKMPVCVPASQVQ